MNIIQTPDGKFVRRLGVYLKDRKIEQVQEVTEEGAGLNGFSFMNVSDLDKLQEEQESTTATNEIVIIPAIDRLAEVDKYLEVFHLAVRSLDEDTMFRNLIKLRNELRVEVMQDANKIWGLKPE